MEGGKNQETNTYHTEEHGTLKAITLTVDEGWNKKGSGCTYNSATGTMNAIGVRSKKVCWSQTLCNRCMYCDKSKKVRKQKEKALAKKQHKKAEQYKKKKRYFPCIDV